MSERRGGSRTLGMKLSNNTSGVNGVWFRWTKGQGTDAVDYLWVCTAADGLDGRPKRPQYSVTKHGKELAVVHAISVRAKAGLPVPSVEETLRCLEVFEKKGPSSKMQQRERVQRGNL